MPISTQEFIKPIPRNRGIGGYSTSPSKPPCAAVLVHSEEIIAVIAEPTSLDVGSVVPEFCNVDHIMDNKCVFDMDNISHIKVLSREEERELLRMAIERGDMKARNKIVEHNLRLVAYVAKSYARNENIFSDLYAEGYTVLFHAIDRFDLSKETKFSTYACVPLTTQILTKRGWKYYNELIPGDETIGYNNGKSEWTKINGIKFYNDAPLMRFGDGLWSAESTPNHKWLMQEDGHTSLRPLTDWPDSRQYESECSRRKAPKVELITAAPFIGGNSPLTPDEAALLAWVLSDGSQYGDWKNNNPSGACIIQKEGNFSTEIRDLLIRLNAYCSDVKHGDTGCLAFNVKTKIFRDIFLISGLKFRTISDLVLDLSPEARKAWFEAWYMAEGTKGRNHITQNLNDKMDAIALTAFLEGKSGVHVVHKTDKCGVMSWHEKNRNPRRCVVKQIENAPVWCPSTDLGSWTARSNGNIYLTGNTWWLRQSMSKYLQNRCTDGEIHDLEVEHKNSDSFERGEVIKLIRDCLYILTDRESDIIKRRFGIGCEEETLDQIGTDYGLSKERIRQVQEKAMEKMQPLLRSCI